MSSKRKFWLQHIEARRTTDLSLIVSEVLELDPFSENLFVFWNRGRKKLKILYWQTSKVKGKPATKISKPAQALNMTQTLYVEEKTIRDKSVEERLQVRQSESRPIMDKLKQWLDRQQSKIPPKSLLGKAMTYAQNQWKYLVRYLDSGLLNIDNNAAQRGIKPFMIGRKNWLFAQSVNGAKAVRCCTAWFKPPKPMAWNLTPGSATCWQNFLSCPKVPVLNTCYQ